MEQAIKVCEINMENKQIESKKMYDELSNLKDQFIILQL